eukprot:1153872-Pelagomonas_calceolata.AAC.1
MRTPARGLAQEKLLYTCSDPRHRGPTYSALVESVLLPDPLCSGAPRCPDAISSFAEGRQLKSSTVIGTCFGQRCTLSLRPLLPARQDAVMSLAIYEGGSTVFPSTQCSSTVCPHQPFAKWCCLAMHHHGHSCSSLGGPQRGQAKAAGGEGQQAQCTLRGAVLPEGGALLQARRNQASADGQINPATHHEILPARTKITIWLKPVSQALAQAATPSTMLLGWLGNRQGTPQHQYFPSLNAATAAQSQ